MSRSSPEADAAKLALFAMGGGLFLFWHGLKQLKLRRKMGDIPTSKISSAAIGSFVEINGRVVCDEQDFIRAPLSNRKGVCFIWKIEKLVRSGKRSHWSTMNTFYSSPFLYVKDASEHLAAIDLGHCDFQESIFEQTVNFDDRSFDLPAAAQDILHQYKILNIEDKASFLMTRKYRISEKVFKRHDPLYVLGSVLAPPTREAPTVTGGSNKFGTRTNDIQEEVRAIFEKAKSDPSIQKMYDEDGNTRLDDKELKQLQTDIQKKIFADYNLPHLGTYLDRCKLFFTMVDDHENLFSMKKVFVSVVSEKELSAKLLFKARMSLIGGPILFTFGLLVLLNVI